MGFPVKAELAYQAFAALLHRALDDLEHGRVSNAVADSGDALELAKVGCGGVAGVEGEELALYVGEQVVNGRHTLDFGYRSAEA